MDPFLAAHYRGQGAVFDFADSLAVISIRDQMMRGLMIADRLPTFLRDEYGEEKLHTARILIVGAGAAGMSAAVGFAKQGFGVEIVDRNSKPFVLQRDCRSRWIDPTQYDWPLDHWRDGQFSLKQASARLPVIKWTSDYADRLVIDHWMPTLCRLLGLFAGKLSMVANRKAILKELRINRDTRLHEIPIVEGGTNNWDESDLYDYQAVIIARGRGPEWTLPGRPPRRRTIKPQQPVKFRGYGFWETDPFESHFSGLRDKESEGTILISGTGDGALQDLLRVVTRMKSARDIYDTLADSGLNPDLNRIHSAEHRTERALNWSGGRQQSAGYLKQLHDTHLSEVRRLLRAPNTVHSLHNLAGSAPARLILVSPSEYFTCTYALNRLLALLIVEFLQSENRLEVIYNRRVERVDRDNAPDNPAPADCLGHVWKVDMVPADAPDDDFTSVESREANVVILRHGLDSPRAEFSAPFDLHPMPRPQPPTHLA